MSIKQRVGKLEKQLCIAGGKAIFILLGNREKLTVRERKVIDERMKKLSRTGGPYILEYSKSEVERIEKENLLRKCDLKN